MQFILKQHCVKGTERDKNIVYLCVYVLKRQRETKRAWGVERNNSFKCGKM